MRQPIHNVRYFIFQEEVHRRLRACSANAIDVASAQMYGEGPDGCPTFIRCSGSQVRTADFRERGAEGASVSEAVTGYTGRWNGQLRT